ncbi:hypothetical protein Tco_0560465 [Tanacetum coccineum]
MYLTASRPDIMFAVCACVRFQVTPKASHLHVVKRIFRYLKHQPKLGLWYPRDSPFELEAFSDSYYAGASLDRKSTTGGCQFLVLWIQNQMMDYGFNFMNTKIHIHNESTICVVKNPVYHSRTKHIEIRHHFIRDCYEKRLIDVLKIHTDSNVADLLTKGFDVTRISMDLRMDRCSAGKFYSYMVFSHYKRQPPHRRPSAHHAAAPGNFSRRDFRRPKIQTDLPPSPDLDTDPPNHTRIQVFKTLHHSRPPSLHPPPAYLLLPYPHHRHPHHHRCLSSSFITSVTIIVITNTPTDAHTVRPPPSSIEPTSYTVASSHHLLAAVTHSMSTS